MDIKAAGGEKFVRLAGLKRARQLAGYSLVELQDKSGVNESMISKLENLKRGAQGRTVRKLAEALGVTPADLVG